MLAARALIRSQAAIPAAALARTRLYATAIAPDTRTLNDITAEVRNVCYGLVVAQHTCGRSFPSIYMCFLNLMSNTTPQQQDWSLEEIRDIFNMPLMELVCTTGQITNEEEPGSPIPYLPCIFFSVLNMNARF
jgi:hypothetical protein